MSIHQIPMPPDTKALEHQVAGHFHAQSKSLLGALQDAKDGSLLKPLQASPNSFKELGFYLKIFGEANQEHDCVNLRRLVPKFLGTLDHENISYLRLENICLYFRLPCIVDIKIGRRTFGPDATMKKRLREVSKCPLAFHVGFQTVGMKRFLPEANQYVYHDRICCRSLQFEEITHGLAWFFAVSDTTNICEPHENLQKVVILNVIQKLLDVQRYFQKQRTFNMYGVSVLIVYEGYPCEPTQLDISKLVTSASQQSQHGVQHDEVSLRRF